jgi:hypothetical protein
MMFDISLSCAIITLINHEPHVLLTQNGLPTGDYNPLTHRTFEMALRDFITHQTGETVGYVEQLYTFGDRGRILPPESGEPHAISVGYLALTHSAHPSPAFKPLYHFLKLEDRRQSQANPLQEALAGWAAGDEARQERVQRCFLQWDDERSLERYELLYSSHLLTESWRDGRASAINQKLLPFAGEALQSDHRRILATALSRLRSKIKYRPVVFELMPECFTLTALQTGVEAILGQALHKPNFRRLVEQGDLVEPTGETQAQTGGRPAALYRFRKNVLLERPASGLRVGARG